MRDSGEMSWDLGITYNNRQVKKKKKKSDWCPIEN